MRAKHLSLVMAAAVAAAACGRGRQPEGESNPAPSAPGSAARASGGGVGAVLAGAMMAEWLRQNPNPRWAEEERERHTLEPSFDNSHLIGQPQGHTYGLVSPQDVALWKTETERVALAGSVVFHSADELGSPIGVSCDMCHPHGANTHPETYPKFQTQMGRVALLRDMINWCIEHPVRGPALESDDPKMRAMEAYLLAQRRGKKLDYGKH
jgi:hypothetical protein